MNVTNILHTVSRIVFAGALALFGLAILELVAGLADTSLIGEAYAAGRLIEMAAALTVPVVAILLREIRDELQSK